MLKIIIQCFYFILPAYFANMAPVIVKKLFKGLAFPIDFNKTLNNNPVLGKNKTFRGLIFGILFAMVIAYLQYILYKKNIFAGISAIDISAIDYSNWILIGFLMGFGAIFGDLIKSFIKRRLRYNPGKPFVPFDQTDFIAGALIFIYPLAKEFLTLEKIIIILLITFALHITVNHIAFYTGIRQEKW